jgi:hypothetical protein
MTNKSLNSQKALNLKKMETGDIEMIVYCVFFMKEWLNVKNNNR